MKTITSFGTRILTLTFIAIIVGSSSVLAEIQAKLQPNIVFIMADDHALEAVSSYGAWLKDYSKTPNIDRLATEGIRFTNFFCDNSICSPARATYLTGQYSHKNGVKMLAGTINAESPLYPLALKKAGYQTAVVGKWHLQTPPDFFDYYKVVKGQGTYFNPKFITLNGEENRKGFSADVYTDVALEWLDSRDTSKPFLLCLQFKSPHHPYDYPDRYDKLLEGVKIPEPTTLYEDVEKTSSRLKTPYWGHLARNRAYYARHYKDERPPMLPVEDLNDPEAITRAAYQHMILKYIRCVAAIDENVGRVLAYLDEHELTDNTIVIYTSDQGYWLGQHGMYDKRLILEGSLKMPFLVRFPGHIKPGTLSHELCSNADLGPTLLDYANAEIPEAMQGYSLRPLLEGKRPDNWRDGVFYSYWDTAPTHWGIRSERYKLIHFPGTDAIEFYDLQEDPLEERNVADDPNYSDAIDRTEKQLVALMRELDVKPEDLPVHKTPDYPVKRWVPHEPMN